MLLTIHNKRINYLVTLIFFLLFFITFNSGIIKGLTKSADELSLILAVFIILLVILTQILNYKLSKVFVVLLLYFFAQFLNYLVSPFNLTLAYVFLQAIINLKLFIVSFVMILLWRDNDIYKKTVKLFLYFFIVLFFVGFVLNMLLQEKWASLINAELISFSYRYGFIRPAGWFGHPAPNAYFFAITLFTFLMLKNKKDERKQYVIYGIINVVMMFLLTVRKNIFMLLPIGIVYFYQKKGVLKYFYGIIMTLIIMTALIILKDTPIVYDTYNNLMQVNDPETTYIRGLMIYNGISLFFEFFPFGVGSATFGTVLSQFNTLAVYEYVGLDMQRFFYSTGELVGVYDSGIASLMAENGFIGILFIILFIYYFFKYNKKALSKYNYKIFKIITWYAIILSITEPVWQNGMFTVFYTINVLYIYSKNQITRDNKEFKVSA